MEFTYRAYGNMLNQLNQFGYRISSYYDYDKTEKSVILRHDVDMSINKALMMADFEHSYGVKSTYFLLLSTKLYNVADRESRDMIIKIHRKGHDIGLHFDEKSIDVDTDVKEAIVREAKILQDILQIPIKSVSMHRPSEIALKANYYFDDLVNSYGEIFFNEFKYLSDSRMRWREDVDEVIRSGMYQKLHILTHPFWYNDIGISLEESLRGFILLADKERYDAVHDNITDLDSILTFDQIIEGEE